MANFKYTARDSSGTKKEGFTEASSSNEVVNRLREQGLMPISIVEEKKQADTEQDQQSASKSLLSSSARKRVKSGELAALCWQLTTMVEGGIPITTCLEVVAGDIENTQLKLILEHMLDNMLEGQLLSESMKEFPGVFNELSCAIILAGESGGNMSLALFRLAEYFDNRDKLAKKVKGAMAYPIFVLVFIVLIVIAIMTFIIPRFTLMFEQMGGDLPGFTRGFMNVYEWICSNSFFLIGGFFLTTFSCGIINKTKKGHYMFCKLALAAPLFGQVFRQAFVATFCKTMSTLLSAGVSVLEVFDILSTMTNNDIIKNTIVETRERIIGGSSISMSMNDSSDFFPNMVVKMVEVGEKSGSLSKVLDRTCDYYERKVDATITTMMGLLEPIMIVTVGGIVLMVVLALYLPIFSRGGG